MTAAGFLYPLGPIGNAAAMLTAATTVHAGKPIWASQGGPELPLVNAASAISLILTGPGALSLDHLLGIRLPRVISLVAFVAALAGVTYVVVTRPPQSREGEENSSS